ncbi:HEAT repeat domain-containing protein [bacterium]|nr:HEAT repeat domain-containing protein [candidate division CSSED10-310 bacterium]
MLRCVSVMMIALCVIAVGVQATGKELMDEIQSAVATLNKAIQEQNDPMRNKMFFKFRLIEQDHPGVVAEPLIQNLKSELAGVPEYTAFILGWVADNRAINPLRAMLQESDSKKRAALQALGNMEAKDALDDMVKLLKDPSERVRQDAAYSLGILGDDRAIPHLEKAKEDQNDLVKWFADEAIQRIQNRKKYGW